MAIKERLLGTNDKAEMIGKDGIAETADGRKMAFTADRPAWWDLEGAYVIEGAPTWEDAMKLGHLDWLVVEQPIMRPSATGTSGIEIPNWKALVRSDNGHTLSVVKKSYHVIQNKFAFDFTEALLQTGAHYESAGVLKGGAMIWTLARVPQADFVIGNGDEHKAFLLFMTAHDQSMSAVTMLTDWRVVCRNTARFALNEDGKDAYRIRHSKSADAKLKAAQSMISDSVTTSKSIADTLQKLSQRQLTRESYEAIVDRLFPKPKATEDKKEKEASTTRRDNILSEILKLYESNDGNAFPDQRGTAYALYNSITNYTDHLSGVRETTTVKGQSESSIRTTKAMFGSGAIFKAKAFDVIVKLTDGTETTRTHFDFVASEGPELLDDIVAGTK